MCWMPHCSAQLPPGRLCILSTQRSLSGPPRTERADGQYNIIKQRIIEGLEVAEPNH